MGETALVPMADLERMATVMAASSMFGKSKDQIISLMLVAQAEGIHPARAVQEYDIIQGKPAIKPQAALARFIHGGGKVEWITRTDLEATAKFHHPSQINPITVTWTIERAKRQGLGEKDNWKKQPGIMLQWRTIAEGVRICDPSCLNRMYTVDEVQDFDAPKMRDVTPDKQREPTAAEHLRRIKEETPTAPKEDDPDNPLVQRLNMEKEIGDMAKMFGADAVSAARETVRNLRDMVETEAITWDVYMEKLKKFRDELKAKPVELPL